MTKNTAIHTLSLACLAALAGYTLLDSAQAPTLRQRIDRLRSDHGTPTNASNINERIQTMREWGDDLTDRGLFFTQQDLQLTFVRILDPSPQFDEALRRWVTVFDYLEQNGRRMGTLRRIDNKKLIAGTYSSVVLEYTVDTEIPKGDGIRLGQNFFNNRPRIQALDPSSDGFVTFKTESRTATIEPYPAFFMGVFSNIFGPLPMPGLRVTSGSLKKGDKIIITIGDTSRASAGHRLPSRDADDYPFMVAADFKGDGVFVPAAMVSTVVAGDAAEVINAVVPSVTAVNEPFAIRLRIEDQYWNPASFDGGKFKVTLNGRALGEIDVKAGENTGKLEGVKIAQEGGYVFEVTSADGRLIGKSNPMLVERNPQQRIYWGELHGHSGWEEGIGTVQGYYKFARDVSYLDFASLTGHDLFLSRKGWNEIRTETEKANRDGHFVAYMGYEWTQPFRFGGHHNVFFKTDKGRYVTRWEAPRPNQLYEKLRAIDATDNVLIIPHAHEPGDWNFNDSKMERLVEIFSMHGSFEYFGLRYLKRGYRVGLIAASDDHTGHPGYSPAIISTRNGLAAVYAPKFDRDSIWQGMKERATYATSNARRPVVKMTLDDKRPGEAIATGGAPPVVKARILGTAPIAQVDLIHNGEVAYSKDYLLPAATDPTGVQIMFFSPTETPGDTVVSPRGGIGWGGWIEVSGGKIASIEPLNKDHYTDEFHQVDDRRIWFTCRTRGDFDGLLVRLSQAPADARIRIIVSELAGSAGGTGASGNVVRPPGPPSRNPIQEVNFKVSDVVQKKNEFKVAENAMIYARKAKANAPWDVSFQYRPTKALARNDYVYLRVVQIDGEVAWVSPIWAGEETR